MQVFVLGALLVAEQPGRAVRLERVRDHQESFTTVQADRGISLTLTGIADPVQVGGERVSGHLRRVIVHVLSGNVDAAKAARGENAP